MSDSSELSLEILPDPKKDFRARLPAQVLCDGCDGGYHHGCADIDPQAMTPPSLVTPPPSLPNATLLPL